MLSRVSSFSGTEMLWSTTNAMFTAKSVAPLFASATHVATRPGVLTSGTLNSSRTEILRSKISAACTMWFVGPLLARSTHASSKPGVLNRGT